VTDELDRLELAELWALFGRLADPSGIATGSHDSKERERLRMLDAGVYVADRTECRSRRVEVTAEGIDPILTVELDGDPDWALGGPAMWVTSAAVSVIRE
jgi:hypothetical protein